MKAKKKAPVKPASGNTQVRTLLNSTQSEFYEGLKLLELLSKTSITLAHGEDVHQALFAIIHRFKAAERSLDSLEVAMTGPKGVLS
jgi:hypothetical protein